MARPASIDEFLAAARATKGAPTRLKRIGGHVRPVPTEHEEQVAIFEWAARARSVYPQLEFLHAIANAGAGAQRGQAGKMKAEGVKPGVPDMCLPVPMHGFHGCYIELKALDGQVRPEQREWVSALFRMGYYATIAYGFTECRDALLNYLRGAAVRVEQGVQLKGEP